jgi:septum formation protein
VLASTSPYRRDLLARLCLPFTTTAPGVDEAPLAGEMPRAMVQRLAHAKATAVARRESDAWVIGSDQAAELDGRPLGKPGNEAAAVAQLTALSGRSVPFHTALALAHTDGRVLTAIDTTRVHVRELSAGEIRRYIALEQAWDCAGSFKAEALGITLFDAIESRDPTALVGLPLIATAALLREAGFAAP